MHAVKIACELPDKLERSLSQWDCHEIARQLVTSGVVDALHRLRGIKHVGVVELDRLDIVRHRLVQRIVQAYDDGKTRDR